MTAATSGGAISAPSEVPTLKKPTAIDFSLSGKPFRDRLHAGGNCRRFRQPHQAARARQPAIDHKRREQREAKPQADGVDAISPQTGCMIV